MQKKKHINCPKIGLIYAEYNCLPLCVWLWHFFLLSVRIIALRRLFPCPSGLFWASHTHTHTHRHYVGYSVNTLLPLPYGATPQRSKVTPIMQQGLVHI